MRRASLMVRLLGALSITLGMLGASFLPAAAGDDGPEGVIAVHKTFEGAEPVGAACFAVTEQAAFDASQLGQEHCIAQDGSVDFTGLAPGTYVVSETHVPDNCAPVGPIRDIIVDDDVVDVSFVNVCQEIVEPPDPGSITVYKVDQDNQPLDGACFTVNGLGPECVDANGVVTFGGLEPGTYTVEETTTPDGYAGDGPKDVIVESGVGATVTFINTLLPTTGWITVYNIDENDDPLAGGCFVVFEFGITQTGQEKCADESGVVEFDDLEPSTYVVVQTVPPPGYGPAAPQTDVEVVAGEGTPVEFVNTLILPDTGWITVYKVDQDDEPLEGACFTVNGSDPECVDEAGVVTFSDLEPGTYTVTEVEVPDGYAGDGPHDVVVEAGLGTDVTFVNTLLPEPGWITVYKVDEYGEPLDGACFTVYDDQGDVVVEGCVDEDGVVVFDDLEPGAYTVVETEVPDGYVGDDPQDTTVVAGEGSELTFINIFVPDEYGAIKIFKEFEGRDPLAGDFACFTVYEDDNGELGDAVKSNKCVDEDGELFIDYIPLGDYIVVETTVPFGFVGDDPQSVSIEEDGQVVTLYFVNVAFPTGDVLVTKKFCDDGTGTSINVTIVDPFSTEGAYEDDDTHCEFGNAEFAVYLFGDLDSEPVVFETGDDGAIYFDGFFPVTDGYPHVIVETFTGASAEFDVEEDRLTIIEVINFEKIKPGTGTLVVHKWFCYGYGGYDTIIDYRDDDYFDEWDVEAVCKPGVAEFAIYLFSDFDADPFIFETGEDGKATITDVPVTSLATPPHVLVETFTGAEFDFDIFIAGETVVIDVFNFVDEKKPDDKEPEEKKPEEVTKLPDTGAGATAFGQGNAGETFFLASLSLMVALGAAYTVRRRAA